MRDQYLPQLLALLLAFAPLRALSECVTAEDSLGNLYCTGTCTGVNCTIRKSHADALFFLFAAFRRVADAAAAVALRSARETMCKQLLDRN